MQDSCRAFGTTGKKSMDANADERHVLSMHSAASSSVEKGKPEGLSSGFLLWIQMVLALVLGWFGVNALLDVLRESRDRDAATVQGYIDSHRQEDEHRQPAPQAAVKAVSAPASPVKARGVIAAPATNSRPQQNTADQRVR
jgi:hypothetical protein